MVDRFARLSPRSPATPVCRPFSTPNPLRGSNSDLAQYSNTPALRAARFEDEDDDEDENEAPCEGGGLLGLVTWG